jgi:hypothetical protein
MPFATRQTQAMQLLTPQLQQKICSGIKKGAFPHVAAQAAGVRREDFEKWLASGRRGRGSRQKYRAFVQAVEQAQAMARLQAESKVLKADPPVGK